MDCIQEKDRIELRSTWILIYTDMNNVQNEKLVNDPDLNVVIQLAKQIIEILSRDEVGLYAILIKGNLFVQLMQDLIIKQRLTKHIENVN
jgi:hypothetical protein